MLDFNKFKHIALLKGQAEANAKGQRKTKAHPMELILLAELLTSESDYQISFDHDQQSKIAPIARGLQYRNKFLATAISIGILPVKLNGTTKLWGALPPVYFADPNVFNIPAGAAQLSEAEALNGIYQGHHSLQTNEGLRIDRHPNWSFRTVQETQNSATTQSMETGTEFKTLGGSVKIVGGDDNYLNINVRCADKTHIAGDANHKNYIIIRLLGSEVKGGTTSELQS